MLPETAQPISVDDHLVEPPHLWQSRLPAKHREAGPRVIKVDGVDIWEYDGTRYELNGLGAVAGKSAEDFSPEAVSFSEMRPGCYDPVQRLADMDLDGVHGEVCFPTFARFAGHRFLEGSDRGLAHACVVAYNDFLFEEWCAAAPERLIPMIILPMWDPVASAAEIRRTAELGAKAVAMSENPSNLGLPSWHTEYWDPVFEAAAECGLPICMHIGSSGKMIDHSPDSPYAVHVALTGTNSMVTAVDLVMSPVFERFPGVRVVLSEGEAGWAPHIMERMDYTWERHRHHSHLRADKRPSEIFREHLLLCFIADQHALENLEIIGVDNLMWESDYPHSDSLWPHSRSSLEKFLADIPDDVALKIAEGNARRVFGIPA